MHDFVDSSATEFWETVMLKHETAMFGTVVVLLKHRIFSRAGMNELVH